MLGQDCILCTSYGEINRRFGAAGLPKVRPFCSDCYRWVGESQPPRLVRLPKTATFDFVGAQVNVLGYFSCGKEIFQNGSPPPSISATLLQYRAEQPATPHRRAKISQSKRHLFDNLLAENTNAIELSPPNNWVELNHGFLSEQTCPKMFLNRLRGFLPPERQEEEKKKKGSHVSGSSAARAASSGSAAVLSAHRWLKTERC